MGQQQVLPAETIDQSQPPPAYSVVVAQPTSPVFAAPPTYVIFATNQVPESCILYPQFTLPIKEASTVATKVSNMYNERYAFDSRLDEDEEELWKYFMTYSQRPNLFIDVKGEHDETRTRVVSDGNGGTRVETYTEVVVDWSFTLDCSNLVIAQWSKMFTVPADGQDQLTVRNMMKEYVSSRSFFKEIHMIKQVEWDLQRIAQSIKFIVQTAGYRQRVVVTNRIFESKVSVFSNNPMSKMAHSTCVRVVCVLTCLCIIGWPLFLLMRRKTSNLLYISYPMVINEEQFYAKTYYLVYNYVASRTFNGYVTLN